MSGVAEQKAQLRRHFRQRRRNLSEAEQNRAAKDCAEQLSRLAAFIQAKTVALYLANDGELSPHFIAQACWQAGKQTVLPVIHPFNRQHLLFLQYNASSQLKPNRFGIDEPLLDCQQVVPLANIDLLLMPLVAFDNKGNRLGMGGGFYDRTLAHLQQQQCQLYGLAHACQQAEHLPLEPWDIPLQGVIVGGEVDGLAQ